MFNELACFQARLKQVLIINRSLTVSNILCRYRKKSEAIVKKKDCSVIQKCKKASLATLWCAASTGDNDVKWLSITGHVMNKHENPLFRKNGLTKMFL